MLEAEPRKHCFPVLDALSEKGCAATSGLDVCGKRKGRRAAKRSAHTARLPLCTSELSVAAPFLSLKEEYIFGEQKCLSSSWEGEPRTHPHAEESSRAT